MRFFNVFCSSILLASICDCAAVEDGEHLTKNPPISRAVAASFPFLTREVQLNTILHHSVSFERISGRIKHASFNEFLHDLVLFNVPELDEALQAPLDLLVDAVEQVAESYIDCLDLPYCIYLPRGLRNRQGAEYAEQVIGQFMKPDGKLNDNVFSLQNLHSIASFIDDMSVMNASYEYGDEYDKGFFKILARADKSLVMLRNGTSELLPMSFTLIPCARMLIRVVVPQPYRVCVELWHADSLEPEILYDGGSPVVVHVEIAPDHQTMMVYIRYRFIGQPTIYVAKVFHKENKLKSRVIEKSNLWKLFETLNFTREFLEPGLTGLRDYDHIFRPLHIRNDELLASFKEAVGRETPAESAPQQEKLAKIVAAFEEPDAVLLPLIKEFLRGHVYYPLPPYGSASWLRELTAATIHNEDPMYQLSAQDFWDSTVLGV